MSQQQSGGINWSGEQRVAELASQKPESGSLSLINRVAGPAAENR
jgi:hypothetical protein